MNINFSEALSLDFINKMLLVYLDVYEKVLSASNYLYQEFKDLPDTLEDIDEAIHDSQARAACVFTTDPNVSIFAFLYWIRYFDWNCFNLNNSDIVMQLTFNMCYAELLL